MFNAWYIYISASALLVALSLWQAQRLVSAKVPLAAYVMVAIVLLIILLTPVGVPDTDQLAPAWLVAIYEFAFGDKAMMQRAMQPLYWSLLLFVPVLLASLLGLRLIRSKQ